MLTRKAESPFGKMTYQLDQGFLRGQQPDEAPLLADLIVNMDPWHTLGYQPEPMTRYLLRDDPALFRFVIWRGEERMGLVTVRFPWLLGAYLELIAIFPAYQGQKLGGQIIQWIIQQTQTEAKNLWTLVSTFNLPGRVFYHRWGFVEIAPLPDLVRTGYGEILLRKILPTPHEQYP